MSRAFCFFGSGTARECSAMSRIAPPKLPPIEFEGLRYQQIINGEREGLDQRTGYLSVTDIAASRRVATIKAYAVEFDPDEEADVQDVFFKRFALDVPNRQLLIESELGQRVAIAIDGLAVTSAS